MANVRKGHRNHVKKTLDKVKTLLVDESPLTSDLKAVHQILSEKLEVIQKLDDSILATLGDDEDAIEKEIEEASEFRCVTQSAIFGVDEKLNKLGKKEIQKQSPLHSPTRDGKSFDEAKYPRIQIKKFSGDMLEFQSFWDCFDAMINKKTTLSDVTKFAYLKSYLQGPALSAVEGLQLTERNYAEAIHILEKRYGNKQMVITEHMKKLTSIPPASDSDNIRKLRKVFDSIEVHVRSLNSLGVRQEDYGSMLVSTIGTKFPRSVMAEIARKMPTREIWDIAVLTEHLRSEIESREVCDRMVSCSASASKAENTSTYSDDEEVPSSTMFSGGRRPTTPITCTYCRQTHPSSQCPTITDPKARKSFLQSKKKCFICLKGGHPARICNSGKKCFRCGGRHHISICEVAGRAPANRHPQGTQSGGPGQQQPPPPQQHPPPPPQSQSVQQPPFNPSALPFNVQTPGNVPPGQVPPGQGTPVGYTGVTVGIRKNTLLQTAKSVVSHGEKQVKVCVLFDVCSQFSFINEDLCHKLRLPTLRREKMILNGFESMSDEKRKLRVVSLKLKGWDAPWVGVSLYVVPQICAPLNGQTIEFAKETNTHLAGLCLADSSCTSTSLSVDILIGGDFYWKFFSGKVIRGISGPVASETSLGWALSIPPL